MFKGSQTRSEIKRLLILYSIKKICKFANLSDWPKFECYKLQATCRGEIHCYLKKNSYQSKEISISVTK